MAQRYEDCVFLNVPFDKRYEPFLRALVFTVHDCGFVARCAREIDDSGQVRLDKICSLISESKFGIHDISRTGLDTQHRLPRFNMPLELGIFLGAQRFGAVRQKEKSCLILDRDSDRYYRYCSDIAGQDIRAHQGRIDTTIKVVRDWLSSHLAGRNILVPGGSKIVERYEAFRRELPTICEDLHLKPSELLFNEHTNLVVAWLKVKPW